MRSSDKKIFVLAVALSSFFFSCLRAPDGGVETSQSLLGPSNCPGTRRVGVSAGSFCPDGNAFWSGGAMFPGTSSNESELARYCMYDWKGGGNPTPNTVPGGAGWTVADCDVVAPFGHPFEVAAADELLAAFHKQIQYVSSLPIAGGAPAPTKVVIVDSAIDRGPPEPSTGFLEHGRMMGLVVRDLACPPQGACLAEVSSQLALPLLVDQGVVVRDEANGGKFGSMSDLARAMYDGFNLADGPGDDRIIVNLSLGWAPEFGGSFNGTNWQSLTPPLRAVYSVITWIACNGGLVVAAAGNEPGGNDLPGPAYPAGWEMKGAPNAIRCANLGGGNGPVGSTSTYRPLLYSASGVDALDRKIANTREGGTATLVSPAANTALIDGLETTHSYAGSSIASASASAIAAVVWSYLGDTASPHDVFALMTQRGVELPFAPEYCLEGQACRPFVRRLSMCRSVVEACEDNGTCPAGSIPNCQHGQAGRDARPIGLDLSVPGPQFSYDAATLPESTNPSPVDQFETLYAAPAVHPFPPEGMCPTCLLKLNQTLLMGISNPELLDLSKPTLKVTIGGVEKKYELVLDETLLDQDGATLEVKNLPIDVAATTAASIEFVLNDGHSHSDQLLIEKP